VFRNRFRNHEYQLTSTAFGPPGGLPAALVVVTTESQAGETPALALKSDRLTAFGGFQQSY
jgi:hypothetical protein